MVWPFLNSYFARRERMGGVFSSLQESCVKDKFWNGWLSNEWHNIWPEEYKRNTDTKTESQHPLLCLAIFQLRGGFLTRKMLCLTMTNLRGKKYETGFPCYFSIHPFVNQSDKEDTDRDSFFTCWFTRQMFIRGRAGSCQSQGTGSPARSPMGVWGIQALELSVAVSQAYQREAGSQWRQNSVPGTPVGACRCFKHQPNLLYHICH